MNCKICIHKEVCCYSEIINNEVGGNKNVFIRACEKNFKNKKNFVELPCKINSKVYIKESENKFIQYRVKAIEIRTSEVFIILATFKEELYFNWETMTDNKGRQVFLAETLAELKKNK